MRGRLVHSEGAMRLVTNAKKIKKMISCEFASGLNSNIQTECHCSLGEAVRWMTPSRQTWRV